MSGRALDPRGSRSVRDLAESQLAGGAAVDLEALTPDEIRGFGHVKVRSLEVFRAREAELLEAFREGRAPPVAA